MAPSVILFLVFFAVPLLTSLYYSFTQFDVLTAPKWSGLQNYQMLLKDKHFWQAGRNVLIWAIGTIPTGIIIGVGIAYLLNQNIRGKRLYQLFYYLPVISMTVAVLVLWKWIYHRDFGLLNSLLARFGVSKVDWLGTEWVALGSVMLTSLWRSASAYMVVFLAGLQAIPGSFYEAAELDGAGRWQQFWRITMPLLSPSIFFVLVMNMVNVFQVFDEIYVLTGGGPYRSTETFVYHIWHNAFKVFKLGYASAQAWVLFAMVGLITVLNFYLQKRWVHYD